MTRHGRPDLRPEAGRLDARQRQRGDALLGALRRAPDVGLGPQHLEDHHGLVDVRGDRGAVGDVIGRQPLGDRGRAPATISSPLRARSAPAASTRPASTRVGDLDGLGQVEDQPAHAGREGGLDAPAELAASLSAPYTLIWWTTSSSRCSRNAAEPGWAAARRDCEVNIGVGGTDRGAVRSAMERISRAASPSTLQLDGQPTIEPVNASVPPAGVTSGVADRRE